VPALAEYRAALADWPAFSRGSPAWEELGFRRMFEVAVRRAGLLEQVASLTGELAKLREQAARGLEEMTDPLGAARQKVRAAEAALAPEALEAEHGRRVECLKAVLPDYTDAAAESVSVAKLTAAAERKLAEAREQLRVACEGGGTSVETLHTWLPDVQNQVSVRSSGKGKGRGKKAPGGKRDHAGRTKAPARPDEPAVVPAAELAALVAEVRKRVALDAAHLSPANATTVDCTCDQCKAGDEPAKLTRVQHVLGVLSNDGAFLRRQCRVVTHGPSTCAGGNTLCLGPRPADDSRSEGAVRVKSFAGDVCHAALGDAGLSTEAGDASRLFVHVHRDADSAGNNVLLLVPQKYERADLFSAAFPGVSSDGGAYVEPQARVPYVDTNAPVLFGSLAQAVCPHDTKGKWRNKRALANNRVYHHWEGLGRPSTLALSDLLSHAKRPLTAEHLAASPVGPAGELRLMGKTLADRAAEAGRELALTWNAEHLPAAAAAPHRADDDEPVSGDDADDADGPAADEPAAKRARA
jgi:hypothetical protein